VRRGAIARGSSGRAGAAAVEVFGRDERGVGLHDVGDGDITHDDIGRRHVAHDDVGR
jgi:hypothetical protein